MGRSIPLNTCSFEEIRGAEDLCNLYSVPNMFAMANSKEHSNQKRMVSNIYSKSYLQSSEDMHIISNEIIYSRLLPMLADLADISAAIDVLELNYSAAMDFIMAYIFGLQHSTNFLQDINSRKQWLRAYQSRRPFRFWSAELPGLISFFRNLGVYIVPKWKQAQDLFIEDWTYQKCIAASNSLSGKGTQDNDCKTNIETLPVVYSQLVSQLGHLLQPLPPSTANPKDPPLPSLAVATEVLDHLAAGHETSGINLTYLMYELSLHPHLQTQLRTEFSTLSPPLTFPPPNDQRLYELPSPRTIDALPLLHAIMMETLRLHAPIPGPQPRITPTSGTTLAGHNIPGGVRVSSLAHTLHRNATVFPEPEVWKPERWMQATEAQKVEMQRWFWAFGSGGRMCVGSNFAMQEMKLIIAAIYSNFSTGIVDCEGVEQIDAYTAGPRSNRLILGFEKVGH